MICFRPESRAAEMRALQEFDAAARPDTPPGGVPRLLEGAEAYLLMGELWVLPSART